MKQDLEHTIIFQGSGQKNKRQQCLDQQDDELTQVVIDVMDGEDECIIH